MAPTDSFVSHDSSGADALLAALRRGDAAAFERMVREYGPRMLAVIHRLLPNDPDAHEALQDAFLSAFKAIGSFAGDSQLGTWLHRIAVNAALMKLRTAKRHPERSIEDLLPTWLDDGHHADWPSPWRRSDDGDAAERAETLTLVRQAISELPEQYRTVVTLRDIEEVSTEETAALLGDSENAVKIRLHRARQALRNILDRRLKVRPAS